MKAHLVINVYDAAVILREALAKHTGLEVESITIRSWSQDAMVLEFNDGEIDGGKATTNALNHRLRSDHKEIG